ncbi:hypothetical protein [Aeromonas sobria]|uniref:hypothetical protein n=1 Tax=Aeromonas sobria TaxID=646 RepID=UPI003F2E2B87
MFKKKSLTLFIAAAMSATTAYAATMSEPSAPVVGFKPTFQNQTGAGAITGELKVGATLTVDPTKLDYDDKDGDEADFAKTIYSWEIDGAKLGEQASFQLPLNSVGKKVTLSVTPVSQTGDPLEGKLLLLSDLKGAGVGGGDENGNVLPDGEAKPYVSNLNIAGKLAVGNSLTASYLFNANGGDLTDSSTYAWGVKGSSAAGVGSDATANGTVPGFDITLDHAGEVVEVSVQAKNGASMIGNTLTVGTDGAVNNEDNGSGSNPDEGGESGNNPDLGGGEEGGKVPYVPADPSSVVIDFTSTANLDDNGDDGVRPVAQKDDMTADFTPAKGASPDAAEYQFTWFADGTKVAEGVGTTIYTPAPDVQGKAITVSVEPKA